jgi:hypothetical protein
MMVQAKRGRKLMPIPSREVLNDKDLEMLGCKNPFLRSRAYQKLFDACNQNISTMRRWLQTYAMWADKDNKLLSQEVYSSKQLADEVTEEALERLSKENDLVTLEELKYLAYLLAKKKLARGVQEEYSNLLEPD